MGAGGGGEGGDAGVEEWVGRGGCSGGRVPGGGVEVAAADGDCESVAGCGCEWVVGWRGGDLKEGWRIEGVFCGFIFGFYMSDDVGWCEWADWAVLYIHAIDGR